MKKYIVALLPLIALYSCSEIEEKIKQTIENTTTSVKEKAENTVKETVNSSFSSLTNAKDAQFKEIFSNSEAAMITEFKGKQFSFPNGAPAYLFKYKADKESLIPFLEAQQTTNEGKSDKTAKKIDGQSLIDKLSFIERLIPANTIYMSFLEDIKTDKNIQYYKLKRFPNSSTIIFNPKTQQFFHLVEVTTAKN
jgi:hypothetical protein